MGWIAIDDGMMEHPKIIELLAARGGKDAFVIHMCAMGWCARGPKDTPRRDNGHITDAAARALGASPRVAALLEAVGIWDRNGTGWVIHDWADYQRVSGRNADRQRRYRERNRGDGGSRDA